MTCRVSQPTALQFKTLTNLEVYGEDFTLRNRLSVLKQSFAQVIYTGKISIYYVLYYGYDPRRGGITTFPNIIFEKTRKKNRNTPRFPY